MRGWAYDGICYMTTYWVQRSPARKDASSCANSEAYFCELFEIKLDIYLCLFDEYYLALSVVLVFCDTIIDTAWLRCKIEAGL